MLTAGTNKRLEAPLIFMFWSITSVSECPHKVHLNSGCEILFAVLDVLMNEFINVTLICEVLIL